MRGERAVMSRKATGGSDDWQTPDKVLELVREVFDGPIGFDPCTTSENPTGAIYVLTATEDGLATDWDPSSAFVNPPYSQMRSWAALAVEHGRDRGFPTILLCPARTDCRWWHETAPTADAVCFWKGRLRFKGAPTTAPFPSALLYWGPGARTRFGRVFEPHGMVVQP